VLGPVTDPQTIHQYEILDGFRAGDDRHVWVVPLSQTSLKIH